MQINAHKDKVALPKMDSNEIILDDILSDQLKLIISNPNKIAEINPNIFNTEKDTLDSYTFAVFTLYSEANRRNWSKDELKDYISNHITDKNQVKEIIEKYETNMRTIEDTLNQIVSRKTQLVGFKWRVVHEVYNSFQGSTSSDEF